MRRTGTILAAVWITAASAAAQEIVQRPSTAILERQLIGKCEAIARARSPDILAAAHQRSEQILNKEINRLRALRQVNPNVRDEEIEFFEQQRELLQRALRYAIVRLDALRVMVAT